MAVAADDIIDVATGAAGTRLLLPAGKRQAGLATEEDRSGRGHRRSAPAVGVRRGRRNRRRLRTACRGLPRPRHQLAGVPVFHVINIKPAKINTSLAFDLYPLLRTEDWLEHAGGPQIYRESCAQELTEALWSYADSPWHDRIDMLGEHGRKQVSQAAWIRSLLATFIKKWESSVCRIGGLFGAPAGASDAVLPWDMLPAVRLSNSRLAAF